VSLIEISEDLLVYLVLLLELLAAVVVAIELEAFGVDLEVGGHSVDMIVLTDDLALWKTVDKMRTSLHVLKIL
jgi:hypothetical protein